MGGQAAPESPRDELDERRTSGSAGRGRPGPASAGTPARARSCPRPSPWRENTLREAGFFLRFGGAAAPTSSASRRRGRLPQRDHPVARPARAVRDERESQRQREEEQPERVSLGEHPEARLQSAERRGVAQLVERRSPKPNVAGSSPVALLVLRRRLPGGAAGGSSRPTAVARKRLPWPWVRPATSRPGRLPRRRLWSNGRVVGGGHPGRAHSTLGHTSGGRKAGRRPRNAVPKRTSRVTSAPAARGRWEYRRHHDAPEVRLARELHRRSADEVEQAGGGSRPRRRPPAGAGEHHAGRGRARKT